MNEYLTFGGGAYGLTTYDYEPTSYFETMSSLEEMKKREKQEMMKREKQGEGSRMLARRKRAAQLWSGS